MSGPMFRPIPAGRTAQAAVCLERVVGMSLRLDHVLGGLRREDHTWNTVEWRALSEGLADMVRWYRLVEAAGGSAGWTRAVEIWQRWRASGARYPEGTPAGLPFAVMESVPDWLDGLGRAELGDAAWETLLPPLNRPPRLYVRANTLRITRDQLMERLGSGGAVARAVDVAPEAVDLSLEGSVYETSEYTQGLLEVQDAASQAVCHRLGVEPGMRAADGCAGAGGKTLHLAALMRNTGRLLALDVDPERLDVLRRRARRAGAAVEVRLVDTTKVLKRRHESFDRLLLDLPCSGLGVLRRNPEARWRLTPDAIDRLRRTQREILARYSQLVKRGGRMVYATCSVLPSEGEQVVRAHLDGGGWSLASEERLGPPCQDTDCFYVAALERTA